MFRSLGHVFTAIIVLWVASVQPATPGDPVAAAEKAYGSGEYETAFRNARKVIRREPGNARAHYIAGASALKLDDVDDRRAQEYLERCLELQPDTPLAHYLLGFLAFRNAEAMGDGHPEDERRGLYVSAADHFEKELALQPGFVKALAGRAIALRRASDEIEPAAQAHEAWIAAAPLAPAPYLSLVRLHLEHGNLESAFAVAERLPEQPIHLRSRLRLDLAVECHQQGMPEGFDRAVHALGSEEGGAWAGLGRILVHVSRGEVSLATEALAAIVNEGLTDEMAEPLARLFSVASRDTVEGVLKDWEPGVDAADADGWTKPEREEHVFPEYPELARKARIEAKVRMLVMIRTDGTPKALFAVSTARGHGFARASVDAIERWRYKPATQNGEVAPCFIVVITDFTVR